MTTIQVLNGSLQTYTTFNKQQGLVMSFYINGIHIYTTYLKYYKALQKSIKNLYLKYIFTLFNRITNTTHLSYSVKYFI